MPRTLAGFVVDIEKLETTLLIVWSRHAGSVRMTFFACLTARGHTPVQTTLNVSSTSTLGDASIIA